MNEQNNRPEKEITGGNITIAIWNNRQTDGHGNSFYSKSVTLAKRYRSGEEWKKTSSFKIDDFPKLIVLLSEIYKDSLLSKTDESSSPEQTVNFARNTNTKPRSTADSFS